MPTPLGKERRIRRSGEYRHIYDEGGKVVGRYLVCFYTGLAGGPTRAGITVSGKIGNACERNFVKRRLREAISRGLEVVDPGALMVIVALRRIKEASFDEILKDLTKVLTRVSGSLNKKS